MFFRLTTAIAVSSALVLAACAGAPRSADGSVASASTVAPSTSRPLVILVSIDGFRADYLGRGATPTLSALAAEGASGPMRPSFPSVTFPNHYTLVTGKHPDHHGIVGNSMNDRELGRFTMASKEAAWWAQAEPIWITAEKAGLTSATMFWPGSESENQGLRPTYWQAFDKTMDGDARVDQLLTWLDQPRRPDIATLYFDIVDTAGHSSGPDAPETLAAMTAVDSSIARLIDGLKGRGLYDNTVLVIVSDHGMTATSPDRVIYFDDLVDISALNITYSGAVTFLDPVPGREAEVEAALIKDHAHGDCWRKADIPARLVLGSNSRVSAIVCSAESGWLFGTRARTVTRRGGAHGYDNQSPEMQAVFIAHGPGVAQGRILQNLDSVDVQPLLGRLLRIAVPDGDGDPADSAAALQ